MEHKYTVKLKYHPRFFPLTGCSNTVMASNACDALDKVMAYHSVKVNDLIEIHVDPFIEIPFIS